MNSVSSPSYCRKGLSEKEGKHLPCALFGLGLSILSGTEKLSWIVFLFSLPSRGCLFSSPLLSKAKCPTKPTLERTDKFSIYFVLVKLRPQETKQGLVFPGGNRQGGTCRCDQKMLQESSPMEIGNYTRDLVKGGGSGWQCWRNSVGRVDFLDRRLI